MHTACMSAATWSAPICRRCFEPLVPSDPGAEETPAMRTTILAYIIAVVGLVTLTFGAWGLFVLNTAQIDIALTDEAILPGPWSEPLPSEASCKAGPPAWSGRSRKLHTAGAGLLTHQGAWAG